MEPNDLTFNSDGSIDVPVDGKPLRYVKESDLLAVKGAKEKAEEGWNTERTTFNTNLAEANRVKEETHQQLLQSQAANEQLKTSQTEHDTLKTRVGELETETGSLKESIGKHETDIANRIRHTLTTYHGAAEDALKDKDLNQLRNVEEAAKIFGNGSKGGKPANYDGGAGGGGIVPGALTNVEQAGQELKFAREQLAKKRSGVTTDIDLEP